MAKVRRRFDKQYKREAVRFLEETGRALRVVAEELQVSPQSLWRWRKQYGTGTVSGSVTPSEAEELQRLRRENAILRQEREFLKNAAASSTGQCNTGVKLFCRRPKSQGFSRSLV